MKIKHVLIIFLILTSHFTYADEQENIYLICEGYNWDDKDKKTKDTRTYQLKLGQNYSIISYGSSKEIVCDLSNNLLKCYKEHYADEDRSPLLNRIVSIDIDRIEGLITHIEKYSKMDQFDFIFEGTCEKRKKKKF